MVVPALIVSGEYSKLKPGKKITIYTKDGQKMKGEVVEVKKDSIKIKQKYGVIPIKRSAIESKSRRKIWIRDQKRYEAKKAKEEEERNQRAKAKFEAEEARKNQELADKAAREKAEKEKLAEDAKNKELDDKLKKIDFPKYEKYILYNSGKVGNIGQGVSIAVPKDGKFQRVQFLVIEKFEEGKNKFWKAAENRKFELTEGTKIYILGNITLKTNDGNKIQSLKCTFDRKAAALKAGLIQNN